MISHRSDTKRYWRRLLATCGSGLLTLLFVTPAGAGGATISALPAAATLTVGDTIVLTIEADFSTMPTLGGGLDVDWDPEQLSLVTWGPLDWGGDPDLTTVGDVDAPGGSISGASSGNFNAVDGLVTMATIEFEVAPGAANGPTTVVLSDDSDGPTLAGFFVSNAEPFAEFTPDFFESVITIEGVAAPTCGDGVTDPGEQCDDGNTQDGDGCSSTCQLPAVPVLLERFNVN